MNLQPAIVIQDLYKSYGSIQALRGVNLSIQPGEIFGFLGPNGAGKTTTVRCMLDLIRPNSGSIRILGLDPQKDAVAVKQKCGYLPGELNLESSLKVRDQLKYLAELRGNAVDWHYVETLAERFGLAMDLKIKNLSKGNKQKVGVVQALMHKSELLILDEPTSGLDPLMQQEVLDALKEAQQAGATVFFSSHIIGEVEAIAERVAIIRSGLIAEVVSPDQLSAMQIRRVRVVFAEATSAAVFDGLKDVTILPQEQDQILRFEVHGEIDAVIKAIARHTVVDLTMERPTLEEAFMAYYQ
ncbi:MAG: ABC transporter ATP-binding protein [Anaerolineae bacterium]|jgi:ABC-2 type transport system ATP-binding protein|nr:ABC transporter ATP-binding protein [Anaerolineae bacterium]